MVEQFVYEYDYLALLIIVGGGIRQKMVNLISRSKIYWKKIMIFIYSKDLISS